MIESQIDDFVENGFGDCREIIADAHQRQSSGDIGRRHAQDIDLFENAQLFNLVFQVVGGYQVKSPAQADLHFATFRRQVESSRIQKFIQQHRMARQKRGNPGAGIRQFDQVREGGGVFKEQGQVAGAPFNGLDQIDYSAQGNQWSFAGSDLF